MQPKPSLSVLSEAYAAKLATSGVPETQRRYDEMFHGCVLRSAMVRAATTAIEAIGGWLQQLHEVRYEH